MQLKLRRIAPLQAGKILAAFYGLISLLAVPFLMAFVAFASFSARHHGGAHPPPLPLMFGMGLGFMVFLPFFYAAMGFVFGVLGAGLYNLLAGWLGGLVLEFDNAAPPVAPPLPAP